MARDNRCAHGNNPEYCPRCKLPPVTQCLVCKELTQTLVHALHGNLSVERNSIGWPLCGNACAFQLKVWLKIQTPRDEGEPRGTVPSCNNNDNNDMREVQRQHVGSSLETQQTSGPVL